MHEDMIRHYVENQSEDEGEFKIWDMEPKPVERNLKPDIHPVRYRLEP